jgi:hypothetical protein
VPQSLSAFCLILDGEFGATTRSFLHNHDSTPPRQCRGIFPTFFLCMLRNMSLTIRFVCMCVWILAWQVASHCMSCHTQLLLCNNFLWLFHFFWSSVSIETSTLGDNRKKRVKISILLVFVVVVIVFAWFMWIFFRSNECHHYLSLACWFSMFETFCSREEMKKVYSHSHHRQHIMLISFHAICTFFCIGLRRFNSTTAMFNQPSLHCEKLSSPLRNSNSNFIFYYCVYERTFQVSRWMNKEKVSTHSLSSVFWWLSFWVSFHDPRLVSRLAYK